MRLSRICLPVLSVMLLSALAACGPQAQPNEEDIIQAVNEDTYWTEEQWIHNAGPGAVSMYPLYLAKEIRGLDAEPEETYDGHFVSYCALGNAIYGLEDFYRQTEDGWEHLYYTSRYDGTDDNVAHWPIQLPLPEEYGVKGFSVAAFDVKKEGELVLFLQGQPDGSAKTAAYLAMHITPEGEIVSVTDLYPAMRELGVALNTIYQKAYVDGAGYYYLISGQADFGEGTRVSVLDSDGKVVKTMTAGDGYTGVRWAMKLPDGSAVFSWTSYERGYIQMQAYDRERNTAYTLLEGRLIDAWLWTSGTDGRLYYVNSSGNLMRCDIRTGSVEECIYYPQLGLDGENRFPYLTRMLIGADGQPELLGSRNGETVLCRLSTEKPEREAIRLLSAGAFSGYIKEGAASFSQKYPDCPVVLEYPEENGESYWDRAMAELVAGRGADMYYVSVSEMRMLQEKGVLADLGELISEETLEALWPAALERGNVNGQLAGIPLEAVVESLLVSDEIWEGDHWTLEEALEVLETHTENQYPIVSNIAFDNYDVFSWLVLKSLADSPFLDMEKGTCNFDNPLFIRALELTGTYGRSFDFIEAQALYPEKNWTAMRVSVNIGNFEDYKSILGEQYHIVGFPTTGESGTYWNSGMLLVVNGETEHLREAGLLLEELLSYDRQYTLSYSAPVRRDMLDNRLRAHSYNGKDGMYIEFGNGMMKELTPGPAGDYRIGEFNGAMEKSVGRAVDTSEIENILLEEVGSYFSGDKDAEAVAQLIQNRVQLYLKERQ